MQRVGMAALFASVAFLPSIGSAHQPNVVFPQEAPIDVYEPEVSKAYFAELVGAPQQFRIVSDTPFTLSIELLSPPVEAASTDYFATVTKEGDLGWEGPFLSATASPWTSWREPWAGDVYQQGPSASVAAEPGSYLVTVASNDNTGKFVLGVGQREAFGPAEIADFARTFLLMKAYLGVPPQEAVQNRVGAAGLGALLLIVVLLFMLLRFFTKPKVKKVPRITA